MHHWIGCLRKSTDSNLPQVILRRAQKKLQLTYDVIGHEDATAFDADEPEQESPQALQAMVMFGMRQLTEDDKSGPPAGTGGDPFMLMSSDKSSSVPVDNNIAVEVIEDALQQRSLKDRGNKGKAFRSSMSHTEAVVPSHEPRVANSMYEYEGKDYSSLSTGEDGEPNDEDRRVFQEWARKGVAEKVEGEAGSSINLATNVTGSQTRGGRSRDVRLEDAAKDARTLQLEDKKQARWQALGYKSLEIAAVDDSAADVAEEMEESEELPNVPDLHFLIGDCTRPAKGLQKKPAIIVA